MLKATCSPGRRGSDVFHRLEAGGLPVGTERVSQIQNIANNPAQDTENSRLLLSRALDILTE